MQYSWTGGRLPTKYAQLYDGHLLCASLPKLLRLNAKICYEFGAQVQNLLLICRSKCVQTKILFEEASRKKNVILLKNATKCNQVFIIVI